MLLNVWRSFWILSLFLVTWAHAEPITQVLQTLQPLQLNETVDLHAHLFMKEGLGWFFHGDFDGPLMAQNWKDGFSSQANPPMLEQSGDRIVVISLYAHPFFKLSPRDSIRRQIAQAEHFTATHPNWLIARSAAEAMRGISDGRRILILSLEGASGILETENDLREFIDQRGIRIVTLLHFTDDRFGGPAFLKGIKALATPIGWLRFWVKELTFFRKHREKPVPPDPEVILNDHGLSLDGRALANSLIQRRVWIDLAHSSDAAQRELIPLMLNAGQPLLYTHTVLRRYHGAERGIAHWQLDELRKSGGVIGLMPSEQMLAGTQIQQDLCAFSCKNPCEGGLPALITHYRELTQENIQPSQIMIGSDFNGGIPHLKPSCNTNTPLDHEGLWNMSQTPALWQAMKKGGAPLPEPLHRTVLHFIAAWKRVTDPQAQR